MEAGGLVERRPDPKDGRTRRVYLSRAGAKLITSIRESVEEVEVSIIDRIPADDLDQAARTMLTIKETLLGIIGGDEGDGDRVDTNMLD